MIKAMFARGATELQDDVSEASTRTSMCDAYTKFFYERYNACC
jgi:hypothetical protein